MSNFHYAYVIKCLVTGEYMDSDRCGTWYLSEAYMTTNQAEAENFMLSRFGNSKMYELNQVKITVL